VTFLHLSAELFRARLCLPDATFKSKPTDRRYCRAADPVTRALKMSSAPGRPRSQICPFPSAENRLGSSLLTPRCSGPFPRMLLIVTPILAQDCCKCFSAGGGCGGRRSKSNQIDWIKPIGRRRVDPVLIDASVPGPHQKLIAEQITS
jgi:hypothetical protein